MHIEETKSDNTGMAWWC